MKAAGLPGSGEVGGWLTAFDIDFTTQPTQTLAPDGAYVIDGVPFTKINTAHELAAMTLTNGVGITITPDQVSSCYPGNPRTLPALVCSLSAVVPGYGISSFVRAWLYVVSGNWAAQYDAAVLANECTTSWGSCYHVCAQYASGARAIAVGSSYDAGDSNAYSWAEPTENVLCINNEINFWVGFAATGTWSSGWPAFTSLTPRALRHDYSTSIANNVALGPPSAHNVYIGARRAGSANAFSCVLGAFKLEYIKL